VDAEAVRNELDVRESENQQGDRKHADAGDQDQHKASR
jgi:hypothetical protein